MCREVVVYYCESLRCKFNDVSTCEYRRENHDVCSHCEKELIEIKGDEVSYKGNGIISKPLKRPKNVMMDIKSYIDSNKHKLIFIDDLVLRFRIRKSSLYGMLSAGIQRNYWKKVYKGVFTSMDSNPAVIKHLIKSHLKSLAKVIGNKQPKKGSISYDIKKMLDDSPDKVITVPEISECIRRTYRGTYGILSTGLKYGYWKRITKDHFVSIAYNERV